MTKSPTGAERAEAIRALLGLGLAPSDVAKLTRTGLPGRFTDREAVTSDYEVRWQPASELSGEDRVTGRRTYNQAGWYVRRLDGGDVPAEVRVAFARLVEACSSTGTRQ